MIRLRDNRFGDSALAFKRKGDGFVSRDPCSEGLGDQKIANVQAVLDEFGKLSLGELVDRSNGSLVDLSETHLDDKGREELRFFKFKELKGAQDDAEGFRLETGNLMGVLRFRNKESGESVQVEVLSRFDKGKDNFFLNYLLSKAFNCALGAESVSAERSPLLELLLDIVFVRRLGEAAKAGLLRHYREFRNNDWNFKGSLDLARHIRENVPLMHGIAYRKREIDLDVPVNRMILMAALTVNRRHPDFFESNSDAADALRQLRMGVTEERDLRAILSRRDCREPVRHPFFREIWEPLRRIARMILEDEQWTLFHGGAEDEEVSGVVFDGSWLWEEYVAKVLGSAGFDHSVNADGTTKRILPVFEGGSSRFAPDFYRRTIDEKEHPSVYDCVLDAKYKRSNPNGGRNDVHQVLCYLLLTGAKFGGLVFPPVDGKCEEKESIWAEENGFSSENSQNDEKKSSLGWSPLRSIDSPYSNNPGPPICWSCFSWAEPRGDDWETFKGYMEEQERNLQHHPMST